MAACIGVGLSTASAVAQTQSPSTINPANPQDRTLTNPQDMTAPLAINPQSRQGPTTPVSPGSNGSYVSPGTNVGPGVTGFDPYNAKLNAQLGGPIAPGSTTLEAALAQAYFNNPTLNAQRAATRATDENVPTALSGYRPRVTGSSSLTDQYLENLVKNQNSIAGPAACPRDLQGRSLCPTFPTYDKVQGSTAVTSAGLTVTQTLFNGFQTANRTRLAEGQVFAARETLRSSEQTTLLNAVTAYMNLLRDAAILELQRSNVNVLEVTLRQTRDRFNAGEVTRTDVAQAEARLSTGRSQLATAESNFMSSRAVYLQVIGVPAPARLAPAAPVDRFSPRTLGGAIARSRAEHPSVTTAMFNVDVATRQVKVAEGALYPTLSAVGNVQKTYGSTGSLNVIENLQASVAAQLAVPLYQGGSEYSAIRQAKETLGQRRMDLDTARDQVQSSVTQAWGQLEAAKAQVISTSSSVTANEIAVNGVREEARVGQRTTLDVLNAQQDLLNARVALVTAQRDRVVASYTVLAATGALSPQVLGLRVQIYDPTTHYHQVRDAWGGVRIPDGR
ncbi:MAG: TolC family outer membrane protein [Xanthobacteraceae bacterium]